MKSTERTAYDIDYVRGRAALGRLMFGLLECNGQFLDGFRFPHHTLPTYCVRVKLPASEVMRFRELTGLDVKEPMLVAVEAMRDVLT